MEASTVVKVGILSDTHSYLDPRIADVIRECDIAIHAGDIMGAHVLEQLSPRISTIAVAGNNDTRTVWNDSEAEVVLALPKSTQLDLPGGTVKIEHGHRLGNNPEHKELRQDHADARLVVYGHTHKRIIDQEEIPWVVNPGAAGKIRTKGGPSCLVLYASDTDWRFETVLFPDETTA